MHRNFAQYLGERLVSLGVTTIFVVPGDFNLSLLDGLMTVKGLTLVPTPNELNAAYAADGAARAAGLGVVVTTFLVGALSALNGIAGAYAEDVPVLSVVGTPSNEEYGGSVELHHTVGNAADLSQEVQAYRPVTRHQCRIRGTYESRYLIDKSLAVALLHRKPTLVEVCRDVPLTPNAVFGELGAPLEPFPVPRLAADAASLAAAAAAVRSFLAGKKAPLVIVGRRARPCVKQLEAFAAATGYAVAVNYEGKGFFDESSPGFIGVAFGPFSHPPAVKDAVAESDALIFVGPHFDEWNWGAPLDDALFARSVILNRSRVRVGLHAAFVSVDTGDLLERLTSDAAAPPLERNAGGLRLFHESTARRAAKQHSGSAVSLPELAPPSAVAAARMASLAAAANGALAHAGSGDAANSAAAKGAAAAPPPAVGGGGRADDDDDDDDDDDEFESSGRSDGGAAGGLIGGGSATLPVDPQFTAPANAPLTAADAYAAVQSELLTDAGGWDVLLDIGDTLLRAHTLRLPRGASFEVQAQAGSIGWATPAALGYSLASRAARPGQRLLAITGDGALQMTVQEIGNFSRHGSNAVVVLINNDGYLVERFLSAVPHAHYNYVSRWDYTAVAAAMCNGQGKYLTLRATTRDEVSAALRRARELPDHFVFIEVVADPADAAPGAGLFRQSFLAAHAPPGSDWARTAEPLNAKIAADALAVHLAGASFSNGSNGDGVATAASNGAKN